MQPHDDGHMLGSVRTFDISQSIRIKRFIVDDINLRNGVILMLESCKSAQERWGGVHDLIDRWLNARQALIINFVQLKERGEFTPLDTNNIQKVCEQLIDYVSTGHFEIYEQLAKEAEAFNDDGALLLLKNLLPEIQKNTEVIIEFNDKFDTKDHCNDQLGSLPFSLQALGLVLAERFSFEDKLIEELHEAHSEKSA